MGKDSEKGKYKAPEGSHTWEYISGVCCTIISACMGNVVGSSSPILSILMAPDSVIVLTPSEASTMAALVAFGHTMGPPLTILLVDNFGRKNSLLMMGAPFIISWGLLSVGTHVAVFYVARFIGGLAIGLSMCIRPIYLGEISSPHLRGGFGMLSEIMFNIGVLFMMVVMPYLSLGASSCICMGLTLVFLISFSFMPESPYFLSMTGKDEAAEASLKKLRGKTDVSDEIELIKATLLQKGKSAKKAPIEIEDETSTRKLSALKQLLTIRGNRKAVCIMLLFAVSHQYGGFVTILTYGHLIFSAVGIDVDDHVSMMIVAVLQLITAVITIFLIDRVGRKPLLIVSGSISGICVMIIGLYFYLMEYVGVEVKPHAMIPFVSMFVLVVAANIGLMPLQTVVISEIFETDIKALASCVFGVIGGLLSTLSTKTYLLMATTWGLGHSVPFLAFAVITWACTGLLLWLLPETKGKTFLQIQKELNA